MKKILATQKINWNSLKKEIFFKIITKHQPSKNENKKENNLELDFNTGKLENIKSNEEASFIPFSYGMTASVYTHPSYPKLIFKKLTYDKSEKENKLNEKIYNLMLEINTIKVPKSYVIQSENQTWLAQENCNLINDNQAKLFYELCDELLDYYEYKATLETKKNIETTIKYLFLAITKEGYWDVGFPNFPNISHDGKFCIIDFGEDVENEYENHEEEAILNLAEIFCNANLLKNIGQESLLSNPRIILAIEKLDLRKKVKQRDIPHLNQDIMTLFDNEIQLNYAEWIYEKVEQNLKQINCNSTKELRLDIYPKKGFSPFYLLNKNLKETIKKIHQVLDKFKKHEIIYDYTKSKYEQQVREGEILHVIFIYF